MLIEAGLSNESGFRKKRNSSIGQEGETISFRFHAWEILEKWSNKHVILGYWYWGIAHSINFVVTDDQKFQFVILNPKEVELFLVTFFDSLMMMQDRNFSIDIEKSLKQLIKPTFSKTNDGTILEIKFFNTETPRQTHW